MAQHTTNPYIPPAYDSSPSVEAYKVTLTTYLASHPFEVPKNLSGVATGALVFNAQGCVLLLQRAAHDSMPNRWETPGGAVDDTDENILDGCARELWEEAGLVVKTVKRVVSEAEGVRPGSVFTNSKGTKLIVRFNFEVSVDETDVQLDDNEHQGFLWASEEEVLAEKVGDRVITLTGDQQRRVLREAFRLRRLDGQ